jgi:hypothetical protein
MILHISTVKKIGDRIMRYFRVRRPIADIEKAVISTEIAETFRGQNS